MKRWLKALGVAVLMGGFVLVTTGASAVAPVCQSSDPFCYEPTAVSLVETIKKVEVPNIAVPMWLGAGQ